MPKKFSFALLALAVSVLLFSCKKTEELETEEVAGFYPMTLGKYITYKLDSSIYIGYTTSATVRSYFVRDLVDAKITDNLNRPAYRIARFIKDSLTQPAWRNSNTFMAVPVENGFEYIENNLRFRRLQNPIRSGFTWLGNSHIQSSGLFSNLSYLFGWEYQYENINQPYQVFTTTVPETITVKQADELDGSPTDPNGYSERNYSIEVFAKGIGLIHKDFLHWIYQPPSGPLPGYRSGYGVKLTMIDHN